MVVTAQLFCKNAVVVAGTIILETNLPAPTRTNLLISGDLDHFLVISPS